MRILWLILGIILYPLVVVLGPPLALAVGWVTLWCTLHPFFGLISLLLIPLPLAVGLIFDVFWVPFGLILVPTWAIVMYVKQLESRSSQKRKAEKRIRDIIENNRKLVEGHLE